MKESEETYPDPSQSPLWTTTYSAISGALMVHRQMAQLFLKLNNNQMMI